MIPVTLKWAPTCDVKTLRNCPGFSITVQADFPAVPNVGQYIFVTTYAIAGPEPEKLDDFFAFAVSEIDYWWDEPGKDPRIVLDLALNVSPSQLEAYGSTERIELQVWDMLVKVYGWKIRSVL